MTGAVITDVATISRDPSYHGWPTIARRASGELLVACSGGREGHVCPYGQVYLMRSLDGGDTWSDADALFDGALDDRDTGLLVTDKGTILVDWFNSLTWINYLYRNELGEVDWGNKDGFLEWSEVRHELLASDVNVREELGHWMMRSIDGGKTWSERYPIGINAPHGPAQLSNGELLYAGKRRGEPGTWRRGSPHEQSEAGVSRSTDDGQTWNWLAAFPMADGAAIGDYQEPHIVQASNGDLIVHIRHPSGRALQTESSDGGHTWSVPHDAGFEGHPMHLLRLADGRLLSTYGYRRKPFGCRASISDDHGRSWLEPMTLYADGIGTDLGYPSTVQLDDGSLVTVWYEMMEEGKAAVIRQARWALSD